MTVDETLKAIEVMQAFVAGKQIQVRELGSDKWHTVANNGSETPTWAWGSCVYRVKPVVKKPREFWTVLGYSYNSRTEAEAHARCNSVNKHEIIHVREVLPS